MKLIKVNGNTYYIPMGTNIGVFQFKDKYTLLVDSGMNNQQARKIEEIIRANNLHFKHIVNTHHHVDHCGGNGYIKENHTGTLIAASREESFLIENDALFCENMFGGKPPRKLKKAFEFGKEISVDTILEPDKVKINNEKFEFVDLPGHSKGQLGIVTKDRVCFIGDALFSEVIIEKYKFPFLNDIDAQYRTYKKIVEIDSDYFILGHGMKVYSKEEIVELVELNQINLDKYSNLILELLLQPKTREEIAEELIILEEIEIDFSEYYFIYSTLGSMLGFLMDQGQLDFRIENGRLYYFII